MERLNITLDDEHAEKLAKLAVRIEAEDRVVVVTIQDARSSASAAATGRR